MIRNIGCLVHGQGKSELVMLLLSSTRTEPAVYRIEGGDSGTFDWYFEDEQYWDAPSGTIILDFGHNDRACIAGSWADRVSLSGWYYDYYEDYLEGYDGISLVLRRVGY